MDFSAAVEQWRDFYSLLGGAAATLLGLLFVAISLRLNIFHQRVVADVRTFSFQTFIDFVFIIVIALVFLIPDQSRAGVGVPLIGVSVVNIGLLIYLARQFAVVNQQPGSFTIRGSLPYYGVVMMLHVVLLVVAGVLMAGRTGALYPLAAVAVGLLALATLNAWNLLSHAGGSSDAGS